MLGVGVGVLAWGGGWGREGRERGGETIPTGPGLTPDCHQHQDSVSAVLSTLTL